MGCNHAMAPVRVPSCSVMSDCSWPHGLEPARLHCPWNSPGKNTGVGCHFLLQGIFPSQGSNLCLLHWQEDSLLPSHLRTLRPILIIKIITRACQEEVSVCLWKPIIDIDLCPTSFHNSLYFSMLYSQPMESEFKNRPVCYRKHLDHRKKKRERDTSKEVDSVVVPPAWGWTGSLCRMCCTWLPPCWRAL